MCKAYSYIHWLCEKIYSNEDRCTYNTELRIKHTQIYVRMLSNSYIYKETQQNSNLLIEILTSYLYVYIYIYSRTPIIRTPVCHFNIKGVQINEFVRISELSDKIHYLAS